MRGTGSVLAVPLLSWQLEGTLGVSQGARQTWGDRLRQNSGLQALVRTSSLPYVRRESLGRSWRGCEMIPSVFGNLLTPGGQDWTGAV